MNVSKEILLTSQVSKNTEDINQLKSNVKWLYQYGGVGGKGGFGGGSSQNWSIYATLDNKVLKNNSPVYLDDQRHKLVISISKPNGLTYTIKHLDYWNGSKMIYKTEGDFRKLSPGNYEYVDNNINIQGNAAVEGKRYFHIQVDCDDDPDPQDLYCYTICNPLSASVSLKTQLSNGEYQLITDPQSIFIDNISNLYLCINYTFYVSNSTTCKLFFENNNINIYDNDNININNSDILLEKSSDTLYYKLDPNILSQTDYFGLNNINSYISIDDGSSNPEIIPLNTQFTLIPNDLFLRVTSSKKLFTNISNISEELPFYLGYLYFNVTPYFGRSNPDRKFNISCKFIKIGDGFNEESEPIFDADYTSKLSAINQDYFIGTNGLLDKEKNDLAIDEIFDQNITTTYITIQESGIYALNFIISIEEGQMYYSDIYRYYIYVKERQNITNWIENIQIEQLSQISSTHALSIFTFGDGLLSNIYSYYYRFGETYISNKSINYNNEISKIKQYGNYISTNSNNKDINLFNINSDQTEYSQYIINIGIQYSKVNNLNNPILTLSGGTKNITIYQNKFTIEGITNSSSSTGTDSVLSIYIPLTEEYNPSDPTKYHLISIVKQKIDPQNAIFSYILYIDGIIEMALGEWISGSHYTSIKLHPGNYSINLIDVANISDVLTFGEISYNIELPDYIISEYYLQYNSIIFGENISYQNNLSINTLDISKNFKSINNKIYVNGGIGTLKNLKDNIDEVPMLLLDISTSSDSWSQGTSVNTVNGFFDTYFFPESAGVHKKITFSSLYYNNFDETDKITIPDGYWAIELQGTSTLGYRIKNLELSVNSNTMYAENGDALPVFIFSPNFKTVDNSMSDSEKNNIYVTSFLPETSFTLKADEMDSSHCNNTSVGLFVNKNTNKFADAQQQGSIYSPYIKNCLTGYPCMLFVQLKNDETDNKEIYYLGIYNFNLGRESNFNLGYLNINSLNNIHAYNIKDNIEYSEYGLKEGFNLYKISADLIDPKHINKNICVAEITDNDPHWDFSQYDPSILFEQTGGSTDSKYMFDKFVPKYSNDLDIQLQKDILTNFVKSITFAGGFIFDTIGKGMFDDDSLSEAKYGFKGKDVKYGYKYGWGYKVSLNSQLTDDEDVYHDLNDLDQISRNMVPNYHYQATRTINESQHTYEYTKINTSGTINDLVNAIYGRIQENGQIQNYPTIDYVSLVEYYVICMALGMVDSVQKNLNIKSWTAPNDNTSTGRFYVAFYDMDTSIGKTNDGGTTNKYAFTDYWSILTPKTNETSNISLVKELIPLQIFRDFFPKEDENGLINNKPGYDVPSSYLFAIAKYASIFIDYNSDIDTAVNNLNPEFLWAKFRQKNGELRNAKYFIDNYFHININKIPIQFISLNYRFKYLQAGTNSFDNDTIKMFTGFGKYYAEDWLNDRFHILDAYFNLQQENRDVWTYDYSLLNTFTLDNIHTFRLNNVSNKVYYGNHTDKLIYKNFKDDIIFGNVQENPDVYIINHIFYEKTNQKIKTNMSNGFVVSAFNMSPLILLDTNNNVAGTYLLPNSSNQYIIKPETETNQSWLFGGSQLWTKIDNIEAFITTNQNSFYVKSDNLRSISGKRGTCNSWQIYCKSLEELILNGPSYGGKLSVKNDNLNDNYWDNLKKIDISSSKISLECYNINCATIICNEIIDSGNMELIENTETEKAPSITLDISNCKLLETFSFKNIKIKSLNIDPINKNDFKLMNCDIQNFTISPLIENTNISINSIEHLYTININTNIGTISSLNIYNCQRLNKIYINESYASTIKKLEIEFCNLYNLNNNENELIYIKSENIQGVLLNVLHLEKLINLEEISFNSSLGFDIIVLPKKSIKFKYKAFFDTDLKYIDYNSQYQSNNIEVNPIIILEDSLQEDESGKRDCSIFGNSPFTISSSNGDNLKFKLNNNSNTLRNIFSIFASQNSTTANRIITSGITYSRAAKFINDFDNNSKSQVKSLEKAFYNQSKIWTEFSYNKYRDLSSGQQINEDSTITLNGYSVLENIEQMFEGTQLNFIDNRFFDENNLGGPSGIINITNFLPYNYIKYVHFYAFDKIKNKIETFLFDGMDNNIRRMATFTVYYTNVLPVQCEGKTGDSTNDNNKYLNKLKVHNFLFNDRQSKITKLCGFNIKSNNKSCIFDLSNLFTENEKSIKIIHDVFNNLNQTRKNYNIIGTSEFNFKALINLEKLIYSFICDNTQNQRLGNNLITTMTNDNFPHIESLINILDLFDWNTEVFNNIYTNIKNIQYAISYNYDQNIYTNNLIYKKDESDYMDFRFLKIVDLQTVENQEKWNLMWRKLTTISGLFRATLFIFNKTGDYSYFKIPDIINSSITNLGSLMPYATGYVKKDSDDIIVSSTANGPITNYITINSIDYIEYGILFKDNSLECSNSNTITTLDWAFSGIRINAINDYPIPENLFKLLTSLSYIRYCFSSITCIGKYDDSNKYIVHKTYKNSNNNNWLNTYFVKVIASIPSNSKAETWGDVRNYALSSIEYDDYNNAGKGYIEKVYPFIPEDLFKYNKSLSHIKSAFSGSDLEGYFPAKIFSHNPNISDIDNFIFSCKIIPQEYKIFGSSDNITGLYQIDNNPIEKSYVFIPDNIFTDYYTSSQLNTNEGRVNHTSLSKIDKFFNFYLAIPADLTIRYYIMTNNSINQINKLWPGNIALRTKTSSNRQFSSDRGDISFIIDTYINSSNYLRGIYCEKFGGINLCINKNNNTYFEGINLDNYNLNSITVESSNLDNDDDTTNITGLINPVLANVYVGYIFKKGTLLDKEFINKLYTTNRYIVNGIYKYYNNTEYFYTYISNKIQYPAVLYYTNNSTDFNNSVWPDDLVSGGQYILPSDVYNKKNKQPNLLHINEPVGSFVDNISLRQTNININQFDMSFLDNYIITKTGDGYYQLLKDGEEIYKTKIQYNTGTNNEQKEMFKNEIKQLIYSNYYLLFNSWSQVYSSLFTSESVTETIPTGYYPVACNLNIYNDFVIYDVIENNLKKYIIEDPMTIDTDNGHKKVKNTYKIHAWKHNTNNNVYVYEIN